MRELRQQLRQDNGFKFFSRNVRNRAHHFKFVVPVDTFVKENLFSLRNCLHREMDYSRNERNRTPQNQQSILKSVNTWNRLLQDILHPEFDQELSQIEKNPLPGPHLKKLFDDLIIDHIENAFYEYKKRHGLTETHPSTIAEWGYEQIKGQPHLTLKVTIGPKITHQQYENTN